MSKTFIAARAHRTAGEATMNLLLSGYSPIFLIPGILSIMLQETPDEHGDPADTGEKTRIPSDDETKFVILCVILWFVITVFLYPEGATPPGFD